MILECWTLFLRFSASFLSFWSYFLHFNFTLSICPLIEFSLSLPSLFSLGLYIWFHLHSLYFNFILRQITQTFIFFFPVIPSKEISSRAVSVIKVKTKASSSLWTGGFYWAGRPDLHHKAWILQLDLSVRLALLPLLLKSCFQTARYVQFDLYRQPESPDFLFLKCTLQQDLDQK